MSSIINFLTFIRALWAKTYEPPRFMKAPAFTKSASPASRSPSQWWIAFGYGLNMAFISFAWQRYFSTRFISLRFYFLTYTRAVRADQVLRQSSLSHKTSARTASFAVYIIWISVWLKYVPSNKWLIYEVTIVDILIPFLMSWVEYLATDGPPGAETLSFTANLDTLYGYLIVGLILFSSDSWTTTFRILSRSALLFYWGCRLIFFCINLPMPMVRDIELVVLSGAAFGPRLLRSAIWYLMLSAIVISSTSAGVFMFMHRSSGSAFASLWHRMGPPSLKFISRRYLQNAAAMVETYECAETLIVGHCIDLAQWFLRLVSDRLPRSRRPQYRYQPLQPGQFRLLRLRRSCPGVLRCSLFTASINEAQDYEAISYHWGDLTLSKSIPIDDAQQKIHKSAFDVLTLMSSIWRDRIVWLDAVCINQQNSEEKADQVRMMYSIYRNAARVVVVPSVDRAYRLVPGLLYRQLALTTEPDEDEIRGQITSADMMYSARKKAIVCLFAEEYFKRVWIIQEISAGRIVHLCLGGLFVPWEVIVQSMQDTIRHNFYLGTMAQSPEWPFVLQVPYLGTIRLLIAVKNKLGPAQMNPSIAQTAVRMDHLLHISPMFNSTDPRDKIFALDGVSRVMYPESHGSDLLKPNYTISIDQVNENAALFLLLKSTPPSIDMLANAGYGYSGEANAKRSWIPQYSFRGHRTLFSDLSNHLFDQVPRFKASEGSLAVVKPGKTHGSISAKGVLCDEIHILSDAEVPFKSKQTKKDRVESTIAILKFVDAAMLLCEKYPYLATNSAHDSRIDLALTAEEIPDLTIEDFKIFRQAYHENTGFIPWPLPFNSPVQSHCNPALMNALPGRCFGITRYGRLCLVPSLTRPGDRVFVPLGAQTPYIIRRMTSFPDVQYTLLGEAYIQGIMHGEAMRITSEHEFITLI